jgi:peptide/nickel transport system substrate-binding protein
MPYPEMAAIVVLVLALAAACQPQTVVVEKEVEKVVTRVVTRVVQEKVKETVIVEGTPRVVVKEATKIVEKQVEKVVDRLITPTPELGAVGQIKPIPRNRTLILGQWGFASSLNGTSSCNPIMSTECTRNNYGQLAFEPLFYQNLNTGTEYPWLAESYEYNDDYTQMTIQLRGGVEWADGEPFDCQDVQFTFEAIKVTEGARKKDYFDQWLDSVECVDDSTVQLNFASPNSRFHQQTMVGHENHVVIVPEHIFGGQEDLATFTNFDLSKGWPVGTGPYRPVLITAQQIVWDLRDDWWGAKTGFQDLPQVERIIATTAMSEDAARQMYVDNQQDSGVAIQSGSFEAARAENPNLRTWGKEGPIYGAPDGCTYQLVLNNAKFADPNVRLALNYAIDRQQLIEQGYQNATHAVVAPLSLYVMDRWGPILQDVLDKYRRGVPDPQKVQDHMAAAGYTKNDDGLWTRDGQVFAFTITTPQWLAPIGSEIAEQLTKAGFDAEEHLDIANQWDAALSLGEHDMTVLLHCGSLHDPWDTLQEFHSKHNTPVGEPGRMPFGAHRYVGDPELDEALDRMEASVPSTTDPEYVEWARTALDVYLRDMPTINLAEQLHVIPMNETFWTGWPTEEDPYVAPYPPWQDFGLVVHHLKPTQ